MMLRTRDDGTICWDETCVGSLDGTKETRLPESPAPAVWRVQKDSEIYGNTAVPANKIRLDALKDKNKKYAHNFKVLDKRSKNQDESIEDLYDHVAEMREELMLLQQSKMSKPSHADELEDAEKYVDDYFDIQRKRKRERWARKQRIQKKLKKIERVNAEPEPEKKWPARVFVLLMGLGIGFLAFTW